MFILKKIFMTIGITVSLSLVCNATEINNNKFDIYKNQIKIKTLVNIINQKEKILKKYQKEKMDILKIMTKIKQKNNHYKNKTANISEYQNIQNKILEYKNKELKHTQIKYSVISEEMREFESKIIIKEQLIKELKKDLIKDKKELTQIKKELKQKKQDLKKIYSELNKKIMYREYEDAKILFDTLKFRLDKTQMIDLISFFEIIDNLNNSNEDKITKKIKTIKNKKLLTIIYNEFFLEIKENRIKKYKSLLLIEESLNQNVLLDSFDVTLYKVQIKIIEGRFVEAMKILFNLKTEKTINNKKYKNLLNITINNLQQQEIIQMKYFYKIDYKKYAENILNLK